MLDLHLHSTFSDGTCTPEELVQKARELGVYGIALTDHDTTQGLHRFMSAGTESGVITVAGVEISADFPKGTMHLLGYGMNPDDAQLNEGLAWICEGRNERNREIHAQLEHLGMPIPWEDVLACAGGDVIGRPHIAQTLVQHGYVRDTREAFKKLLARGRPAYVERRRMNPYDGIQLITKAGGVPVLAHPSTLGVGGLDLREVVGDLAQAGLQGIEVYYPEHTQDMRKRFRKLAEAFDLVETGGSDYHGSLTPDLVIGRGFGNLQVEDVTLERLLKRRKSL
ncbi:MAG: PHP domain-containing protein [Kiritimatiellae bacterium]|nr:PHP domain-containing protein [Kiritimatiellia bacterium]